MADCRRKDLGVDMSDWVALENIHGTYEAGYELAPELCRQLLDANPMSVASCSRNDVTLTFEGLCIAFKPFIQGFKDGCRPLIGLDGCFLKGKYGGVLLAATSLDGNNGLYPLAIYICKNESYETWKKFLGIIKDLIEEHPSMISFISDRENGLAEVLEDVFPDNPHRSCLRHLYSEFKKLFKGNFMNLVWGAAEAYEKSAYKEYADQLKKTDQKAYDWFHVKYKSVQWARSHFDEQVKCEHITKNFSESFNAWILDLTELPVHSLVDQFHLKMMNLLYERRKRARTWDKDGLVPRANRFIDDHKENILSLGVIGASDHIFVVYEYNTTNRWTLDLEEKTCTCKVWDITGIPCVHAVAVINQSSKPWAEYCSDYHKVSTYLKAYAGFIMPMPMIKEWGEPPYKVKPPEINRPIGRLGKKRSAEDEEPATTADYVNLHVQLPYHV